MRSRVRAMVILFLMETDHLERISKKRPLYRCMDCDQVLGDKGRVLPHFSHYLKHREIYFMALENSDAVMEEPKGIEIRF